MPIATRRQAALAPIAPDDLEAVRAALGELPLRRDLLIEHLHRIQDRYGQLAKPHLRALADLLRLAVAEVYEVASFYHHFRIVDADAEGRIPAAPRVVLRVCEGLPCAMAGAGALERQLRGSLRGHADVRIEAVPCVGRCAEAPAAFVGRRPVAHAAADVVLDQLERRDPSSTPVRDDDEPALPAEPMPALRACLQGRLSPADLFDRLERSGLRGLGGAGFPAVRKWRSVAAQPAPRLLVVNLDEGEPGTFKDRHWVEREPLALIEGAQIAAWAVGAERIYVYVRDEYLLLLERLRRLLAMLAAQGLDRGWPAPVELRRGAGAYICGEESALIESIEGKRGLPRLRPPYVAERGLFGRPTLEHNAETLMWLPAIVQLGPQVLADHGRRGRRGLLSFSVSGRVNRPGVYRAPAGITLNELVAEYAGGLPPGHRLYGYLPGGASGGILPARLADLPLDFDTLQPYGAFIGSAAVIVLTESAQHRDRAIDAARNLMRFFAHESCGQCTPCRGGTDKALQLMQAPHWDRPLLEDLGQVMRDASICGLGQAAPNAFESVWRWFAHELEAAPAAAEPDSRPPA
jgi:formate dehydrogenase